MVVARESSAFLGQLRTQLALRGWADTLQVLLKLGWSAACLPGTKKASLEVNSCPLWASFMGPLEI